MVELGKVQDPAEIAELRSLIEDHRHFTGSQIADRVLRDFHHMLPKFVRVMPLDYKRVLEETAERAKKEKARQSLIDLIPSQTASQVDLAATGFDTPIPSTYEASIDDLPAALNKKHEPTVTDMEDAALDETAMKERAPKINKTRGFMLYKRQNEPYRAPRKRVKDWNEVSQRLSESELKVQTARCMDCGVPFCQSDAGCPISNIIPKWNDLVFKGQWKDAYHRLMMTNSMPEFTGRVCPAPCEGACVLGINETPVGIKSIECAIIDKAFEMGWVVPNPPKHRTGKKVAIIGSGPAGLAAADALNRAGHSVTVYERQSKAGGLLYFGIPNMKLDKRVVQRRIDLFAAEGINFICNANVGVDIEMAAIREENDAVVLATGATAPRDLKVEGREKTTDVQFAMTYLASNTKSLVESNFTDGKYFDVKGKNIIVIGGGDTVSVHQSGLPCLRADLILL